MDDLEPLFSCQNGDCSCECSYPEGDLRLWYGKPICENCYDGEFWAGNVKVAEEDDPPSHSELPRFVPAYRAEIESLRSQLAERDRMLAEIAELTKRRQLPLTHQINDLATTHLIEQGEP